MSMRLEGLIAALMLWCGPLACGDEAEPTALRLGILASLSGDLAEYGRDVHRGTLLAVDEINRGGGINGHPLQVETRDDGTTQSGASVAFSTLVNDRVAAVVGPGHSAAALAIEDQVRTSRVVTISGSTTAVSIATLDDGGYFFRTVPGDDVQGQVLVRLVGQGKVGTLCVVHRGDAYGSGLFAVLQAQVGIPIIEAEYDPEAPSIADVMLTCEPARVAKAPGIAFITFEGDGQILLDAASGLGWRTPEAQVFLVDGNKAQRLYDGLADPSAFEGAMGTSPAGPDATTPEGERLRLFRERFFDAYGTTPGVHVETNYDATYLAAAALTIAGDDATPEQIRDAMAQTRTGTAIGAGDWAAIQQRILAEGSVNYEGASGPVDLVPETGELSPPHYIAVWTIHQGVIEDLRVEIVEE